MINLSNKTVLFFDASGGFAHMAEAVVTEFAAVKYFSVWEEAFPHVRDFVPGTGLDGIERVADFFDALEGADLVVFTDVGAAGLQEYLRQQGVPVFGSGHADRLEHDRWYLKSVCKRFEIGAADAIPVTGLENLRNVLGAMEDDVHVKLTTFRGDIETFKHSNQADTTRRLNELALKVEPYGPHLEFVVEQSVQGSPCVEVGADLPINVGGVYPRDVMWGYEIKDATYAGRVGELPARVKNVVDKFNPLLERLNYRCAMSVETRETNDGSYLLDFTARFPNPPSALMRFMIGNWAEIMWEGAHGRVVEPEWSAPVGVQIILKSEYAKFNPIRLSIGEPDRTVLYGHCAYADDNYAVTTGEALECAAACGMGTSLAQAMAEACDVAAGIEGRDIIWDAGKLEELTEAIETGGKLGINWE